MKINFQREKVIQMGERKKGDGKKVLNAFKTACRKSPRSVSLFSIVF